MIPRRIGVLCAGFALDFFLGDPHDMPHPIRLVGKLIDFEEKVIREALPKTEKAERIGGALMVVDVVSTCALATWGLSKLASRIHPAVGFAVESIVCYQMLAARSLCDESMKVHDALETGTLDEARTAVSMIVGRDTDKLDGEGVARAAVETVAENASDGVIAPILYMGAGGLPAMVAYKAVNTMDSMVGYKNERYRHFGTAAAKLDDVLNYVPARLAGALMCAAAAVTGDDAAGAWRVFKRDRLKHSSPNSAHTEAACAGALGVKMGGGNWYFGEYVEKPTIGDDTRPLETEDIPRANRLMYATATLALGCVAVAGIVVGALSSRKPGRKG